MGSFKLSIKECPTSEKDKEEMKRLSYASAVASLIYAMVCTRPDIAHAVSVVSRVQSWQRALECNSIDLKARLSLSFGNGKTMLDG